jgi:molecular chaperone DnaK
VKDAQSHAADDQARRELIDARNHADSLAYQVEKTVNENREKVPVGDLSRIEAAIAEARKAAQGEDLTALKRATDDLQHASHAMDDDVIDAEYAETSK